MNESKGYCWDSHKFNPNSLFGRVANYIRNSYGAITDQVHPMDRAYNTPSVFGLEVLCETLKSANQIRKEKGCKEAAEFIKLAYRL